MEIPLDYGLLVPVISIENYAEGSEQILKGDCIYTIALADNSTTLGTGTTNLLEIPVQCDRETFQALTNYPKETVSIRENNISSISTLPVQNKEPPEKDTQISDQEPQETTSNSIMEEQISIEDLSVLYYNEIYNYLLSNTFPEGVTSTYKKSLRRRSQRYSVINGILYHGKQHPKKVIISKKDQKTLLDSGHIETYSGKHRNEKQMIEFLKMAYFWETMPSDVNTFINNCEQCQNQELNKTKTPPLKNELLDSGLSKVWKEIELQLLGPFTQTRSQNEYIVALIDPTTEWISARPLSSNDLALSIAAFIYETFTLIGFTKLHICGTSQKLVEEIDIAFKGLLSDLNDFLAHFVVDLNIFNVKTCQTKCQWAVDLLQNFVNDADSKWDEKLKHFVFAYCCTFTKNSLGSPFLRMYKRLPYNETEGNLSTNTSKKTSQAFQCDHCNLEFSSKLTLRVHKNRHKLNKNSEEQTSEEENEEGVDEPGVCSTVDFSELNFGPQDSQEDSSKSNKLQRRAKVKAISKFRKNYESVFRSGGLSRLEKLMSLINRNENRTEPPTENIDVKSSTVSAVKQILETTKEERRFRGKYHKYSIDIREKIAKYCFEHGSRKTCKHFSKILGIPISESTVRNILKAHINYSAISLTQRDEIAQYALHYGSESAAKHYSDLLNRVIKRCHVTRYIDSYLYRNKKTSQENQLTSENECQNKNEKPKIIYNTELKEKIGEYACRTSVADAMEHFRNKLPFKITLSAVRRFRKMYMDKHRGTLLCLPNQKLMKDDQQKQPKPKNQNNIVETLSTETFQDPEIINNLNIPPSENLNIAFTNSNLDINSTFETFPPTLSESTIFSNTYNFSQITSLTEELTAPTEQNNILVVTPSLATNNANENFSENSFQTRCDSNIILYQSTLGTTNLSTSENINPTPTSIAIIESQPIDGPKKTPEKLETKGKTNKSKRAARQVYSVYTPELRAEIGRYAAEHGTKQTFLHFRKLLGYTIPGSTIRGLRDKYLAKKECGNSNFDALEYCPRGRPMRLGKYDNVVKDCIKDLINQGEKPSAFLAIATAHQVLKQQDPSLLEENGGSIKLNITWAKSFLKRMGLQSH